MNESTQHEVNKKIEQYLHERNSRLKQQMEDSLSGLDQIKSQNLALQLESNKQNQLMKTLEVQIQNLMHQYSLAKHRYSQIIKQDGPEYKFKYINEEKEMIPRK
ncbi:Hypothetical_protein [Hexamita inflata]|uniref:Hypothetical_protein n=1 Tax=Hexamita inflata TaxID=28002 RepID=A0AA86NKN8_9EUKA|nr:Hypothetical protein HINF_LOCUS8587 [Hexamita inflata]